MKYVGTDSEGVQIFEVDEDKMQRPFLEKAIGEGILGRLYHSFNKEENKLDFIESDKKRYAYAFLRIREHDGGVYTVKWKQKF